MEKDDYEKNLYWITKEEAKSMKLIPVTNIFERDDCKNRKFKVYISNSGMWYDKFKTFDAFINHKDEICETKVERHNGDSHYVFENGEWNYFSQVDITEQRYLRRYKFSDYNDRRSYTTQKDIEEYIKIMQAKLDKELEERKQAADERREVFGWTDRELNF